MVYHYNIVNFKLKNHIRCYVFMCYNNGVESTLCYFIENHRGEFMESSWFYRNGILYIVIGIAYLIVGLKNGSITLRWDDSSLASNDKNARGRLPRAYFCLFGFKIKCYLYRIEFFVIIFIELTWLLVILSI